MDWKERTIPQERPFQASKPDFSPYCHTKAIAVILLSTKYNNTLYIPINQNPEQTTYKCRHTNHSTTLETCTAQVGNERALEGSVSWREEARIGNSAAAEAGETSVAVRAKPLPIPKRQVRTTAFFMGFSFCGEICLVCMLAHMGFGFGGCNEKGDRAAISLGCEMDQIATAHILQLIHFVTWPLHFKTLTF